MSTVDQSERAHARAAAFNLLKNLTLREVRSQYKRTALGRVWSLINPLAQIAVYSLVFGLVIRVPVEQGTNSGLTVFPLWIGIGVIAWGFISNAINMGMSSLLANAGLLTKVYFPRSVLVTSTVISCAFTFATELLVLLIVMVFVGGPTVLLYAPLLIPLILLTAIFALGIALTLSVVGIYFRDLQHLWGIFSQVWMYGSGVMFSVTLVRQAEQQLAAEGTNVPLVQIFTLNPAERLLEAYRNILYDFAVPSLETWGYLTLWAVFSLVVGMFVFQRLSKNIVEEI